MLVRHYFQGLWWNPSGDNEMLRDNLVSTVAADTRILCFVSNHDIDQATPCIPRERIWTACAIIDKW